MKLINTLASTQFETPLGTMTTIANDQFLYFLEFSDWRNIEQEIEKLSIQTKSIIKPGSSTITSCIHQEMDQYFSGKLKQFKTPMQLTGTSFQKNVWKKLTAIPYGATQAYLDLATTIGNPLACRAVARANSTNKMAIIIPCHRIINASGGLGGYSGGIHRKKWLIEHEKRNSL